jgi:hypothetical protein
MANPINPGVKMTDLKSKIMRPSLSSVYGVVVKTPRGFKFDGFESGGQELLELTCVEATLPGSSLGTIETNRDFRGVIERHAYSKLYDETIDFTFMVTMDPGNNSQKSYFQIKFFEAWMRYIVGEDVGDNKLKQPTFQSTLRYPEDYQADLAIVKFEKDLGFGLDSKQNILVYEFVQAFPKAISSVPVSYEGSNVLKTTVSFTYTRYFISEVADKEDVKYAPPSLVFNPWDFNSTKNLYNRSGLDLDIFNSNPGASIFGESSFPIFRTTE